MTEGATDASHPVPPPPRAVLLGASNLARGLASVFQTTTAFVGRPVEIFAAIGHGRSYGMHSAVLGRRLAGVLQCGLWDALAARPTAEVYALLTDVGNDLMYEVPVPRIAAWVRECLDRLIAMRSAAVLTVLPVANIEPLTDWSFNYLRSCFYPNCSLSLQDVAERSGMLNEELRSMCRQRGISVAEMSPRWYGYDPIHIKYSRCAEAWRNILSTWLPEGNRVDVPPATIRQWWSLHRLRPQQRWIFGIEQRRPQPAARWPDGTTLALY